MSQSDFVSRGQALVAAGQYQEAVKVCRLGLLGRPTTVEGRVVLGSALLALKRYDEVLAEMRVALELDHTAVPAHALKAEALLKKGDTAAAIEALNTAQHLSPSDERVQQLLSEAQNGIRPRANTAHPAVGFVGAGDTKHYPGRHNGNLGIDEPEDPASTEHFTKPTSLSSPGAPRRTSSQRPGEGPLPTPRDPTPPPVVLAVDDKSGTVEVDPDLEGVELDSDLDFDDLAAPPPAMSHVASAGARGVVKPMLKSAAAKAAGVPKAIAQRPRPLEPLDKQTPTMDLVVDDDDSDIHEVNESSPVAKQGAKQGGRSGGTAVRNAVAMPSGPIDIGPERPSLRKMAAQPYDLAPLPGLPPPPPLPPPPRPSLAAALPTVAAMAPLRPNDIAPPQSAFARTLVPPGLGGAGPLANQLPPAQRQTMIASAVVPPQGPGQGQGQSQGMFRPPHQSSTTPPNWGAAAPDARSLVAANEPTAVAARAQPQPPMAHQQLAYMQQQAPMDPALQAMLNAVPSDEIPMHKRTGIRKSRSKLQVTLWIFVGIIVIGGGVFAGFQIRALRLKKQIAAARSNAMELAKNDTYSGWASARDELSRIVQASGTGENQAALARSRALIAYEFDDGLDDAKITVDALADKTSVEANIAVAYLALAQSDAKAARMAANNAVRDAPSGAEANYVAGQAALLAGDLTAAVKAGKLAVDKESRLLYQIGLARIYAAATNWGEAMPALDRALGVMSDQPSAVIERAIVLADSGKLSTDIKLADQVRGELVKLLGDKKPGLSRAQIGFGYLALAQIDFERGDATAANKDVGDAAALDLGDQRFAEEAVETLYMIDQLAHAQNYAKASLVAYPQSARLHLSLALIDLAQSKGTAALAALKEIPDADKLPAVRATRGAAKLAVGDIDGARVDLEEAQKAAPRLEAALVGRAWLELAQNDPDAAKKVLGDLAGEKLSASPTVITVNAAILRRDPATRDKAKTMLETLLKGPAGPDSARAQLELARVYHDNGDFSAARTAYATASATGNFDARLESGLLLIENGDPKGGGETLDMLLAEAGEHPAAQLVLETARARMLAGDHEGAAALLAGADKLQNVVRWKVQRERGRLYLRRQDFKAALTELGNALEGCGSDAETFLLAADAASSDEKSGLTDKIRTLLPARLKGQAESLIVSGKLLLATGMLPEAEAAYKSARDQLGNEKASPRRLAQANYGLAVVAYGKQKDTEALQFLALVIAQDPSIYDAYLFDADLDKDKVRAFEMAKQAVMFNTDYPRAWYVLGKLAARNNDRATLATAIGKLQKLAPGSEELAELQKTKLK